MYMLYCSDSFWNALCPHDVTTADQLSLKVCSRLGGVCESVCVCVCVCLGVCVRSKVKKISSLGTEMVCICTGFSSSQCVSYTADFMITCTGYNKQSWMLHCLQSCCVSSFSLSLLLLLLLLLLLAASQLTGSWVQSLPDQAHFWVTCLFILLLVLFSFFFGQWLLLTRGKCS